MKNKLYVVIEQEDCSDEYGDPPFHVCISYYEDDSTDAICWMSDDLITEEALQLAKIMCDALNKAQGIE